MEECGYCKERDSKTKKILEEIEKEKVRECQKALEREKIAKGMQCTKDDEVRLRAMQKMQMLEKENIEQREEEIDRMWHQVLLNDVRRKEQYERMEYDRKQQEMVERRRVYDEQIAGANSKKRDALQQEREKENKRLEKIKKTMEKDHYEAIRKKKEQQMTNRVNFIEGHENKLTRIENERAKEREVDDAAIRAAVEELRREKLKKRVEMHNLQIQKQVFVENHMRERRMACELEEDADRIAREWKEKYEHRADEIARNMDKEKNMNKQKSAKEYRRYLIERKHELERERQERNERMERVKRTAVIELQRRMDGANDELRRQIEYRNGLTNQIRENQRILQIELDDVESKQRHFTKKREMFKDAMENKIDKSPGRKSTNPVHPFRRLMEKQKAHSSTVQLPQIGKKYY